MVNPVSQPPVLRRGNGFGFAIVGRFYDKRIAPAYFTLYVFFALWVPVLPLLVYIVTNEGGGYRFYGKLSIAEFHRRYGTRATAILFATAILESALVIVLIIVILFGLGFLFSLFGGRNRW